MGAAGESAGVASVGEKEVKDVGEEEGPKEGNGAEEEEGGEEDGDAEGVPEDDKGLEPAFKGDVERGEADARWGSGSVRVRLRCSQKGSGRTRFVPSLRRLCGR